MSFDFLFPTNHTSATLSVDITTTGTNIATFSIDDLEPNKLVWVRSSDFPGYGVHLIDASFYSAELQRDITFTINHQQPIVNLQIITAFALVNADVDLVASVDRGTHMDIEWVIDNVKCHEFFTEVSTTFKITYQFTEGGQHSIVLKARNALGQSSAIATIEVFAKINGFEVTMMTPELIQTTDTAEFHVTLSDEAIQPMGSLRLKTGIDGAFITQEIVDVTGNGLTITLDPIIQGHQTASIVIFSEVDEEEFLFEFDVWDMLIVSLVSNVDAVEVNGYIEFDFLNPPPSGFDYVVEYGNASDIVVESLDGYQLPFPDGILYFSIEMKADHPTPDNVTCQYNFDDGTAPNSENVDLKIVEFSIHDFGLRYRHLVDLNLPEKAQTTFTITLLNITRVPPFVTLTWDFGDGSEQIAEVMQSYIKDHVFAKRDTYVVSLTVDFKSESITVLTQLQIPLPASDIMVEIPDGYQLPFPDGILYFSIEMTVDHPTPTSVTCQYNFDDSTALISDDVDLSFRKVNQINHTYAFPGSYDVVIKCSNLVSERNWTLSIEIVEFSVHDFGLRYRHLVGLNSSETAQATFVITLLNIARVPPFVTLTWDFGDGSGQIAEVMQSYIKDHVFAKRDSYVISLTVEFKSESTTLSRNFKTGVIDFEVDVNQALITTGVFTFTVSGIEGTNVNYVIESGVPGMSETIQVNGGVGEAQFSYSTLGRHWPSVTGWNDTFTEYVKLTNTVTIEVLARINGFDVTMMTPHLIQTTDTAEFKVTLSNQAIQPMGSLKLKKGIDSSLITQAISNVTENGLTITIDPIIQGHKIASIIIFSEVDEKVFLFELDVWDMLNVSLISNVDVLRANDYIEFDFLNPPPSGFDYVVEYGNGDKKISNEGVLYSPFSASPWTYMYSVPGTYKVTLFANNPAYELITTVWIRVQFPIPALDTMVENPDGYQLPFPDGILYFSIEMIVDHPTPTNVTCQYNFDDGTATMSEEVDLSFGNVYQRNHTYEFPGSYDVVIHCSNLVSERNWTLSIEIVEFSVHDFGLRYRHLVGLNSSETVQTTFAITLLNITRVPPFVILTWNFGDGSGQITEVMQSYIKSHVFAKRDTYVISLTVDFKGESTTISRNFTTGVIDVEVDVNQALITTGVFTFTVSGIEGTNVNYVIESGVQGMSKTIQPSIGVGEAQFSYNTLGRHWPSVTGWNDTFKEYVKLTNTDTIEVLARVNGFEVTMTTPNLIQTTDTAEFKVTLSDEAIQPMGSLQLKKSINGLFVTQGISNVTENGLTITIDPISQGHKNVSIVIFSELDEEEFLFEFDVWDMLKVSLVSSVDVLRANDYIEFNFLNPPPSGFDYVVEYGNGHKKTSPEGVLYSPFSASPWTYKYSVPGTYKVTLFANNPAYELITSVWIRVQFPIPASDIVVENTDGYQLPFPDGTLDFSIQMTIDHPTPTNVTCQYNFDDGTAPILEKVDLSFGNVNRRNHTYTFPGSYEVVINCSNLVSERNWTLSIEIVEFSVHDFGLRYRHLVGLNSSETVQTTFAITLLNITRVPPFVTLTWDFGDGSGQVAGVMQSYIKDHVFAKRDTYVISLTVSFMNESITLSRNFRTGVIDFEVDVYQALIITGVFTFTVSGIEGTNVKYVIESGVQGMNKTIQLSEGVGEAQFSYSTYGIYWPSVTGWNDTFTEFVKLPTPVYTDNPIEVLELRVNTETVYFPPGIFVLNITIPPGYLPLPNLHCEIDFDEVNDRNIQYETQSVTDVDPLVIEYTFKTLNYKDIYVYCYNLANNGTNTTRVQVVNECFASDGMFDEQFGVPETPLRTYTAIDVEVTNHMEILCFNYTVQFDWRICKYDKSSSKCTDLVDFSYPQTGTMQIQRGTVPEGLYGIELKIKFLEFKGLYAVESTYIYMVKRQPFAFIVGGFLRKVKTGRVKVDGVTESFDVDGEPGVDRELNKQLIIEYNCTRYDTVDMTHLEMIHWSDGPSGIMNTSCGHDIENKTMVIPRFDGGSGFIVTVHVSADNKHSTFTQLVVVDENPPDIVIKCRVNCMEKVAVTKSLQLVARCNDCTDDEFANADIRWNLKMNGKILIDTNSSLTAEKISSFVLPENFLEPGTLYVLDVTVDIDGRSRGLSALSFYANRPPYHGSCDVKPDVGNASDTSFDVRCTDWYDEGLRKERDPDQDGLEVLQYSFIARKNNQQTMTEDRVLSFGMEPTAPRLKLPLGDPANDYEMQVVIQVKDVFGDFTEFIRVVKVKPPINIPTMDDDDSESSSLIDTFIESSENEFNRSMFSKDPKKVSRAIETVGSVITAVNVSDEESVLPDSSKWQNMGQGIDDDGDEDVFQNMYDTALAPKETKLKDGITLKTSRYALEISQQVTMNTNSSNISAVAAYQFTGALNTLISKSAFVNPDIAGNVSAACEKLADRIMDIAHRRPLPVGENLDQASASTIEVIANMLLSVVPEGGQDMPEDINTETIRDMMEEMETFDSRGQSFGKDKLTEEEKIMFVTKLAQRNNVKKRKQIDSAKKSVGAMRQALWSIATALSKSSQVGQELKFVNKTGISMSVEKRKRSQISNQTISRKGVKLEFGSSNPNVNDSDADEFDLEVSVIDNNPYVWGNGASNISSQTVSISVKNKDEQSISLPLSLKMANKGVPTSKNIKPVFIEGDRNRMAYIRTKYSDPHDVLIFYIYPSLDNVLYHVYYRSADFPTKTMYDLVHIRTMAHWTEFGLKYFIRGGMFKEGYLYLGIQPDVAGDSQTPSRKKRSISNDTDTDPLGSNFTISYVTTGCRVWNEGSGEWESTSCEVSEDSDLMETVCICKDPPGMTFATTFFVPPNTIDFSTVFTKFDLLSNGAVFGTVVGLICLYIIILIWAKYKDKKDSAKWSINFLADNEDADVYFYLITVYTGIRKGSGTTSNVNCMLVGEHGESGMRVLSDGINQGFESGSTRQFVAGVPEPLGDITYIRIWHDNSGKGSSASWYLHKVDVLDLQENKRFVFVCDRWLSFSDDDGQVERILPLCPDNDLLTFENRFKTNTRNNITENHLWVSVVIRPDRSNFTRAQRLSCLVALLFLTMIANAMFFKSGDNVIKPDQVTLGPIRFSMDNLFVSIVGILITTPPIVLVTVFFRKARPSVAQWRTERRETFFFRDTKKQKTMKEPQGKKNTNQGENIFLEKYVHDSERLLPHFLIYIAWFVIFAAIVTSGFFVILYSMEWGKTKSEEWLSTFLFSLFESIFIVDPIKVILLSALVSFLCRSTSGGKQGTVDLDQIRRAARTFTAEKNDADRERLKIIPPLDKHGVEKERTERKQILRAQNVLLELILYMLFLVILFSISFSNRDTYSYYMKQNIDQRIYSTGGATVGFVDIRRHEDVINWFKDTFFGHFFPEKNFNGERLGVVERALFSDLDNLRVGPARFRQLRTTEDKCYGHAEKHHKCYDAYSTDSQDEKDYCIGWKTPPCPPEEEAFHLTSPSWRFTQPETIWGISIQGEYSIYEGGGYILNLNVNQATSVRMLDELVEQKWIDRQSRAVFVEFTLYNVNINLFVYVIYLVEFPETGGTVTWSYIQPLRTDDDDGPLGSYILVCQVIFLMMLLGFSIKLLRTIYEEKLTFFMSTWNIMDMCCIVLSYTSVGMYFTRKYYMNETMTKFQENKKKFVTFQHIIVWDFAFSSTLAFLVFFATVRLLKILGYNKRMSGLAAVVRNVAGDLFGFLIVFILMFLAFTLTGTLLFGSYLKDYKDVKLTMGTLANSLIGKNRLDSMIKSVPLFAQLYFFTYSLFIIFTMLTIFTSMLNESISTVHKEISKEPESYGVINLLLSFVHNIFPSRKKKDDASEKNPEDEDDLFLHRQRMAALDIKDPVSVLKFLRGALADNSRLNTDNSAVQPLKTSPRSSMKSRKLSQEPAFCGSPQTIMGIQCSFMEDELNPFRPQWSEDEQNPFSPQWSEDEHNPFSPI
ncbi:hypothetical protein ScPMuIL_004171 [Solemya velum]